MSDPGCPRVSVVIPCYRAAGFVAHAVKSVLAQGRDDVQIVVVNDGSPDARELRRALEPFGDAVQLVDQPHLGLAASRNTGIAVAQGHWLAFLDADDAWKPGFLKRQLAVLDETNADMVYCDAEHFGDTVAAGSTVMSDYPSRGEVTAASLMLHDCQVVMSTVVVRADAVRSAGGFDPDRTFGEDLELWIRLALNGAQITYHDQILALRRIHPGNMSRDEAGMLQGVLEVIAIYASQSELTDNESRRLEARCRRLRGFLHVDRAKQALQDRDPRVARRQLWKAVGAGVTAKRLVGALAFTLAPGLATRLFRERFKPLRPETGDEDLPPAGLRHPGPT